MGARGDSPGRTRCVIPGVVGVCTVPARCSARCEPGSPARTRPRRCIAYAPRVPGALPGTDTASADHGTRGCERLDTTAGCTAPSSSPPTRAAPRPSIPQGRSASAAGRGPRDAQGRGEGEGRRTRGRATRDGRTPPAPASPARPRLRTPGRLRLPRHQDTSATLAGAYPFLAEGGLGSDGVFVGQDLYCGSSFVYDPWVLYARGLITAPNLVLAGIVGSGKSSLAKSLYTRSIPFGRRVYVPGDPKGEHTAVAEAVGGKAIALGHGMANRLNPLDEGHRPTGLDDAQWASQVTSRRRDLIGALAETVLDRRLTPLEHTAIDVALSRRRPVEPTCPCCRWSSTASSHRRGRRHRRPARRGRPARRARAATARRRRPGRTLRRAEHRAVRPDACR